MSYQKAQQTRQAILDHLRANPKKSANQIAIDIGATRNTVQSCVKFMTDRNEVSKVGYGQATRYTALATTTISADQVIAEMQEKRRQSALFCISEKVKPASCEPWRTRSCDLRNPNRDFPLQNQGGQGASMPRMATYMETMG